MSSRIKISDEDKETIKKAVEEAKEVLKDTNAEASKYEEAAKELANKVMPIGAKLYQANSADKLTQKLAKPTQMNQSKVKLSTNKAIKLESLNT